MDITPLVPEGRQVVQAYGNGGFRVSGRAWPGSVLVSLNETMSWPVTTFAELTLANLEPLLTSLPPIELLLIGCGRKTEFLPKEIRQALRQRQIPVEIMDTGAACRTFTVLSIEERRVGAALIAVD